MFGYIRPFADELKLYEYAYYRAAYCGLCHEMARSVGSLSPVTLRYDFVFLALARMVLTEEPTEIGEARCAASPFAKHPYMKSNASLRYAARAAGLLTLYGVKDNVADERGAKKLLYTLAEPTAKRWHGKAVSPASGEAPLDALDTMAKERLAALAALEASGEPSPDAAAEPFGHLLGALFSAQLKDEALCRIARSLGEHVGRFIYLCDAVDDAPADALDGSYNPVVKQAELAGLSVSAYLQTTEHAERLRCAMLLECDAALRAIQLAPGAERHPAWQPLENILLLGMPRMTEHVLLHPGEKLPRRDPGIRV